MSDPSRHTWLSRCANPSNALAIALAILLPLQISFVVRDDWFRRPPKAEGDGLEYENIAFHLAMGKGYLVDNQDADWRGIYEADADTYRIHLEATSRRLSSTGRPPLFPTLVAGLYAALGRNEVAFGMVRLFSAGCLAVAGAISAWAVALYFEQKPIPRKSQDASRNQLEKATACVAIATAILLAATNRTMQSYANDFLTEPLALLLMQFFLAVVIGMVRAPAGRSRLQLIGLAGIFWGLLILTRSIFVLWTPGILLLLWWTLEGSRRQRFQSVLLFGLFLGLVCSPWWIRNCLVLGELKPLGTQGPITLLGGYSDEALAAHGEWQFAPEQRLREAMRAAPEYLSARDDTQRELMVCRQAGRQVQDWIRGHLVDLPSMFVGRVVTHWNPYFGRSLLWKLAALIGAILLLSSAVRESGRPLARTFLIWLIGTPVLSTVVVALLYSTGGRFLVPLYGVLITLAGIGVGGILRGVGLAWNANRRS